MTTISSIYKPILTSLRVEVSTSAVADDVTIPNGVVVMELVSPALGSIATTISGDKVAGTAGVLTIAGTVLSSSTRVYFQVNQGFLYNTKERLRMGFTYSSSRSRWYRRGRRTAR